MLRFPYLPESLPGPAPPSMPASARERYRPLVPLIVHGPLGATGYFTRALIDCGADDTVLPLWAATQLGVPLLAPVGHAMRWRGQAYPLRFGVVHLELRDDAGATLRWQATVAFTLANIRYPLLGLSGCLEFMDAKLLGKDLFVEIEANSTMP